MVSPGGEKRNDYLYVSDQVGPDAPVVVALHGGGSSGRFKGRRFGALTGLAELAEFERFVAVFPSSLGGNWNDVRDFAPGMVPEGLDDVGFLLAVLDDVQQRADVDPNGPVGTVVAPRLCEPSCQTSTPAMAAPRRSRRTKTVWHRSLGWCWMGVDTPGPAALFICPSAPVERRTET